MVILTAVLPAMRRVGLLLSSSTIATLDGDTLAARGRQEENDINIAPPPRTVAGGGVRVLVRMWHSGRVKGEDGNNGSVKGRLVAAVARSDQTPDLGSAGTGHAPGAMNETHLAVVSTTSRTSGSHKPGRATLVRHEPIAVKRSGKPVGTSSTRATKQLKEVVEAVRMIGRTSEKHECQQLGPLRLPAHNSVVPQGAFALRAMRHAVPEGRDKLRAGAGR